MLAVEDLQGRCRKRDRVLSYFPYSVFRIPYSVLCYFPFFVSPRFSSSGGLMFETVSDIEVALKKNTTSTTQACNRPFSRSLPESIPFESWHMYRRS